MTSRKRARKESSTHSITRYLKSCPSPKRFKSSSESTTPSPAKLSVPKNCKLAKICIEKLSNIHNLPVKYISDLYSSLVYRDSFPYGNKYSPLSMSELHDTNVAGKIRDYLDNFLQCRYQENDTLIVLNDDCNYTLCVVGPPGSGKTSIVRMVAKALGLGILEVNTSHCRTRAHIIKLIKEATQTYSLTSADRSCCSVILIEDIEVNLEEDKGFHAAVLEIMQESKSPVILTCSYIPPEFKDRQKMKCITLSSPSDSKLALKLDLINSIENNSYSSEEMRLLLYYTNYNLHAILSVLHISVNSTQDLSLTLGFQKEITCFWNKYKGKHVTCISKDSNCCMNTGLDELSNISNFIHDNLFQLRVDLNLLSDFEDLFCHLDMLEFALEETDKSNIKKPSRAEVLYRQESFIAWIHEFYLKNSGSGEYVVRQKYSSRAQEEAWASYRDMNIQGDITDYLYLSQSCRDIDKPRMSTRRTRQEDLSSFQRPVSTSIKFRNTVC